MKILDEIYSIFKSGLNMSYYKIELKNQMYSNLIPHLNNACNYIYNVEEIFKHYIKNEFTYLRLGNRLEIVHRTPNNNINLDECFVLRNTNDINRVDVNVVNRRFLDDFEHLVNSSNLSGDALKLIEEFKTSMGKITEIEDEDILESNLEQFNDRMIELFFVVLSHLTNNILNIDTVRRNITIEFNKDSENIIEDFEKRLNNSRRKFVKTFMDISKNWDLDKMVFEDEEDTTSES